ncbi:MAG: hypothetical protein A3C88_00485 [Candidatus Yanofskybacteria bacterium RIFCSPHIGHO2_02_FULL_50_12]|uniref:Uncharacterized protein n=1 Tax=Candidatus Yanofskybacteria bacterium RIFCSPHIGHO2_02_FULL_50_12 TaxID=1802685 RepID=A0A1F8FX48_9BACT|nr:MAG: hypothetical protein A3C88_00485 [Candidatus Yanofskybacteria bacterium RIFCSPHIGHO2_02_FULL_50_12]
MLKNRKVVLVVAALCLLLLIAGVVVQSLVRQNQASRVASQVRESVVNANNKQKGLEEAIHKYKNEIEFVRTHQPILKIGFSNSSANSSYCDDLLMFLIYSEAFSYYEDIYINIPVILGLLNANQCAL